MSQTVFSSGHETFVTRTEGENLRLEGLATIGADSVDFHGQVYYNENYVADYSRSNIFIADSANYGLMPEIASLWVQLVEDITAKQEEEEV